MERFPLVGGMDEVGRGALAGPVTVGLAVVGAATPEAFPAGLADSKLLSARRREDLVGPCRQWLEDWALGSSTPGEIDAHGIVGALRLAGLRALAQVAARGHLPDVVLLDGSADWLSRPHEDLLTTLAGRPGAGNQVPGAGRAQVPGAGGAQALGAGGLEDAGTGGLEDAGAKEAGARDPGEYGAPLPPGLTPPVRTRVRADAHCAVVAAASVLAKVHRDGLMRQLEDPGYGWASNKGYAARAHVEGLARLGASDQHRRSWRLPGLEKHERQGMIIQ
ncbi:ribonuclease HII [Actinomyces sp. oral taxon 897]|uniref:ribonuclease HII n=1 Tax=Actinomyces sp. oral taxon 897 TaxID=2081702 RepID=UPI000D035AC9|nr:ribonuclease HII [Actinomyces sp. oral taxon 897]AVM62888.1 ribonuclease HII [Actinomyces sp. oral taxon 897]